MANRQQTKNRIKTIGSIRKTTNAMRLVSSTKIRRMRIKFEQTKEYARTIEMMVRRILNEGSSEMEWLDPHSDQKLVIVITSDMGLAAGYNSNIFRLIKTEVSADSELIVIGRKMRTNLKEAGYQINEEIILSDKFEYADITRLMDEIIERYKNGEIGQVSVVYTEFVNTMTFRASKRVLLPVNDLEDKQDKIYPYTEYEPSEEVIMARLIPQYLKSVVYNLFYESKTSEQSARRLAMEQATDNADELIEMLQLEYNQARQEAITQELTEIVAAGEA